LGWISPSKISRIKREKGKEGRRKGKREKGKKGKREKMKEGVSFIGLKRRKKGAKEKSVN
jgi:hypothetical protein